MSQKEKHTIEPVAYISNGYNEKFGVPRQSGLACSVKSEIVFQRGYRDENMLRGIEQYTHLWLVWGFSENAGEWSPTVRPPKLGGNKRVGVFATRSPFRPNGLGLSCVKLEHIVDSPEGKRLVVAGADLKNGTPIYDIKPYLPYVDSKPDAKGGFSDEYKEAFLCVEFSDEINSDDTLRKEITEILSLDPRPQYQEDFERVYGISYKNKNIKFVYRENKIIVIGIENKG